MSFGISKSVKSREVQICTAEMLREAIDSPLVAQVCAEIKDAWEQEKRGEITLEEFEELKGRLKKQLPILTPHATFRNGRRLNADAVPSGLSMYDLDHIPDPEGRWREIEPRKEELGIVMAHITPSTEGLRLIFIIPEGKSLAEAQRWMAEQLGDQKYDECVKDYARSSFVVPREYVLYMSDKLWTDPSPALPQGEGVVTTDNGVDSHTPSPLRGTTPILGVESSGETEHLQSGGETSTHFVPLRQGDEREARRGYDTYTYTAPDGTQVSIPYTSDTTPSPCGRARSSEEAPSVLLCLGRGALPSATRGQAGEGSITPRPIGRGWGRVLPLLQTSASSSTGNFWRKAARASMSISTETALSSPMGHCATTLP